MTHIYICSCDENGGIYHYILLDGQLRLQNRLAVDRPMYMAISGKKAYILLREVDEIHHFGGVITCDIAPDGTLHAPTAPQSTLGIVPCYLQVTDLGIYVANYLSGSVVKLPQQVVTHIGKGVDPVRQEAPHTHCITEAPDGKLLCCDLGIDTIFTYDSQLNELSQTSVSGGEGPRHLAFSADGKVVYCVSELGNSLNVFDYDCGSLQFRQAVPLLPAEAPKSTSAAIRRVADTLYISHRGADCISRVQLMPDGSAKWLDNTPCGGKNPWDILPVGEWLLSANEQSNNVTLLRLSDGAPALSPTDVAITRPLCICAVEL